jgi:cyclopropane-fatty-acyl-phospholipid synthase
LAAGPPDPPAAPFRIRRKGFAMTLTAASLAERAPLPDFVIRAGMRRVIATNDRQITPPGTESLAQAEVQALAETCNHAGLRDGQQILELGCGWGSLSFYMAEKFPTARITAVSNSAPQRDTIERRAREGGFGNLSVITSDMNDFATGKVFDRVVSVEMFEHMANWRALLSRVRGWLEPDGRLFLHVFTHRHRPARYDGCDPEDWMGQHFFTGGIMPTPGLIRQFPDLFSVEEEWRWSGTHYQRTALDWLQAFDANRARIDPILDSVYGNQAAVWRRRWRMFFLATAESFGFKNGEAWGVNHFRLRPG